jgi:universal stress protein A
MPYKHILAAVDLTEEADQVFQAATGVAAEHGATLSILSVIKPLAHVYGGLDMAPIAQGDISFEAEAQRNARNRLADEARKWGVDPANVDVRIGSPAIEIRDAAEALDADLIVIGTHGRHGLGLLLGSTANGVLHGVKCDVLTIRIR